MADDKGRYKRDLNTNPIDLMNGIATKDAIYNSAKFLSSVKPSFPDSSG